MVSTNNKTNTQGGITMTREQKHIAAMTEGLRLMSKKVPYVFGGEDETGSDCSGLMLQMAGKAGVKLPRVSAAQIKTGTPIPVGQEQPGDLLGFNLNDRNGAGIEHIGYCIGAGLMIHTANKTDGICVVDYKEHYGSRFTNVARII